MTPSSARLLRRASRLAMTRVRAPAAASTAAFASSDVVGSARESAPARRRPGSARGPLGPPSSSRRDDPRHPGVLPRSPHRPRAFHAAAPSRSMFDALKSMVGMTPGAANFEVPENFSLDDFAALTRKVKSESLIAPGQGGGLLDALALTPDQIDAIVAAMTEEEKAAPGRLRAPEHRAVAARAAERLSVPGAGFVAPSDVAAMIQHAAMLRIVMGRVSRALKSGAESPPTSVEAFGEIVARSQKRLTREEAKAEARSLDGAFPGNRPCPCASGRKYKSCCSPHGRGGKR